ncbi:MAG: hypothetical protein FJZ66_03995 [Bacteroidetes bacterium]|nr:hypothetical protein [Bacteroidota bacterium]
MKLTLVFLAILPISSAVSAQYKFEKNGIIISTNPHENKEKGSVDFGLVFEIMRLENTSSKKRTVSFHADLYYDGVCANCRNKEYQFTFVLGPGEIIKGNILDKASSGLKYFKEDKNKRLQGVMTDLQLSSFTVEE